MKKMMIFLIAASMLLAYGCNRQKECRTDMVYNLETGDCECDGGMVYNNSTKQCACLQAHDQNNLPILSDNQYISWEDLVANYEYYVKSLPDYPYYQHEGKTFKVCGWIRHSNDQVLVMSPDSLYAAFGVCADSSEAFSSTFLYPTFCHLEAQPSTLESVDMDKKCYIVGTLTFEPCLWFTMMTGYPRGCHCPEFALRVNEIHN